MYPNIARSLRQTAVLAVGLLAALFFSTSTATWGAHDAEANRAWDRWSESVQALGPEAQADSEREILEYAAGGARCTDVQVPGHAVTDVIVENGSGMAWKMSFVEAWKAVHTPGNTLWVKRWCYGPA